MKHGIHDGGCELQVQTFFYVSSPYNMSFHVLFVVLNDRILIIMNSFFIPGNDLKQLEARVADVSELFGFGC